MQGFNHYTGKYFELDDAKIYYEIIGNKNGPVLLCLHGSLGNIEVFNDVIPELREEFKIIGIDNRGHGMSTLGSTQALSYEFLQKEVEAVLRHLNIEDLNILGFSNGGTIAYRLAALSKLKIKKLITIGSPWCTKHVERSIDAFSKITVDVWKEYCRVDYEQYQKLNPEPNINHIFELAKNMALDKTEKGRPNERVKNITCPLLSIRGESDPIVSYQDIQELAEIVAKTQLFNVSSAGHEALKDQPKLLSEKLKSFLIE